MPLTPAPTTPTYPFIIAEISGAGGSGKTHFACSSIGLGPMAYIHSSERPGTMEKFAAWGAQNGCPIDWANFGFMIDGRWSNDEVKRQAEAKLHELLTDVDTVLAGGKYATVVLDSLTFLKNLIFLSLWGPEPPKAVSKKGTPYVDRRKIYGPVNDELQKFYAKFRNQPLRKGPGGRIVGTSLIMTSEGKAVYTEEGDATDEYVPKALGNLEFATDFRAVVAGPTQASRANTITYHKGGPLNKLNKPQPRTEFPEAVAFLLGVRAEDWGRGPNVPPSFGPVACPGPKCKGKPGNDNLEWKKVDGGWVMFKEDGTRHECP